ncbi:MAG: DUF4097 domain-containing protein [Actinobacteria bacterium]|nr:DUF4097 domain-containing protein [Actinomycetota bacterium]
MTALASPPPAPTRGPLARSLAWGGGLLAGALILASAASLVSQLGARTATSERVYDARAVVELIADGDVTVRVGTGDEVGVIVTARYAWTSPDYSQTTDGDRLVITHTCRWWGGSECRGDLAVVVPAHTRVVVRTSNGSVQASGLLADVEARTSNGSVDVTDVDGDVTAVSSNGSVRVSEVTGDGVLSSSSGSVEARDIGGSLEAQTSNGDVAVSTVGGSARLEASSGSIDAAGVLGDVDARTDVGDVTVHGTGKPVALDMATSVGEQVVDAPTDPSATTSVTIRSSSGSVSYLGPKD